MSDRAEALRRLTKLPRVLHATDFGEQNYERGEDRPVVDIEQANTVSSQLALQPTMHAPCLDIDWPCGLIESSTPGHFHLYIDKPMTWAEYDKLLDVLVDVGIVEEGYRNASSQRGATHLRAPWERKG